MFFLLTSVTGAEVGKTKAIFLEIQYSCLNTSPFYYNYNILFCLNYMLFCLNNFDFDYCSFFCLFYLV